MARIKLLSRDEMSEEQKALYDLFPSNLVKGLLATKTLPKGYAELGTALRFTELSPAIREFAIVRVACLSHSEYELMQHRGLAMQQGWTQEDISALAADRGERFDGKMRTILQFTNECVANVKVSDAVFAETRKYLSEAEIAELTLLIGHYMMTARFLETLDIDLDSQPTSWDNVKQH